MTTHKWMIPKNKCQSYEQVNESLLEKKYQCWQEIKMNDCWKQISMLRKRKSMIAKNTSIQHKITKSMIVKKKHLS